VSTLINFFLDPIFRTPPLLVGPLPMFSLVVQNEVGQPVVLFADQFEWWLGYPRLRDGLSVSSQHIKFCVRNIYGLDGHSPSQPNTFLSWRWLSVVRQRSPNSPPPFPGAYRGLPPFRGLFAYDVAREAGAEVPARSGVLITGIAMYYGRPSRALHRLCSLDKFELILPHDEQQETSMQEP
jgi:hypothetical protein